MPGFIADPGKKGGTESGPNPCDRGRPGSKHHLVTDGNGLPLAVALTAANVADTDTLEAMLDAVQPIAGRRGRPRKRPHKLHADKGYSSRKKQESPSLPSPRNRPAHRTARRREQRAPGAASLESRADLRLAAPLSASAHPLGASCRRAPRLPPARLLPHRFQLRPRRVLLGALSGRSGTSASSADVSRCSRSA